MGASSEHARRILTNNMEFFEYPPCIVFVRPSYIIAKIQFLYLSSSLKKAGGQKNNSFVALQGSTKHENT